MKILRVIETFLPNITGPVNQAYKLSLELEKRKIHSPIITTYYNTKNTPKEEVIDLVSVKRLKHMRIMQYCISPLLKKTLKKSHQDQKIDIIHAHTYRSFQTEIAGLFARKHKIPFVLSTHGSLLGYDKYLKNNLVKLPYRLYDFITAKKAALLADAIIVNSKQEYQEALSFGILKEKLHLIPVGIDICLYKTAKEKKNKIDMIKEKQNNKLILLFVARISRNRNLELIVRALAILKKELEQKKQKQNKKQNIEEIELRIIGKEIINSATDRAGYIEEIKILAKALNVDDIITFTGEKQGNDLINEYKNANIFIYTSLSENFGQPLLEAGASGLPIITTNIGIASEIIIPGKTGYLINYDAKELSEKIRILFDKKKREIMGRNIQAIIKQNYSWEKIILLYEELYSTIVRN